MPAKVPIETVAVATAAAMVGGMLLMPTVSYIKSKLTPSRPVGLQRSYSEGGISLEVFYDTATSTLTFVVYDPATSDAVLIDPVLDFDPIGWQTSTKSIQKIADFIKAKGLNLLYSIETHVHADHLTPSQWVKRTFPKCKLAIGNPVCKVQETFKGIFDLPASTLTDGSQFDKLLADKEVLQAGSLKIKAIGCPGHTPACMSYLIGNFLFTGDALFLEDCGSGRCDFPKGSAEDMYESIHEKLYKLPDSTIVCPGHDYPGGKGRSWNFKTTIGSSKKNNASIRESHSKAEYVKWRKERDAKLANPHLIFQSVQVNLDAGKLPAPHGNGLRYLTIPLNLKTATDDASIPIPK